MGSDEHQIPIGGSSARCAHGSGPGRRTIRLPLLCRPANASVFVIPETARIHLRIAEHEPDDLRTFTREDTLTSQILSEIAEAS